MAIIIYKIIILIGMVILFATLLYTDKFIGSAAGMFNKTVTKVSAYAKKRSNDYERKVPYLSPKKKKAHKKYNEILATLGLRAEGVTVWGLKLSLLLINCCVVLIGLVVFRVNIFVAVGLFFISKWTVLAVLNLRVCSVKERREFAVLDALDIIISGVDQSIKGSIEKYVETFDKSVRGSFERFLRLISMNVPFENALLDLTENLGPHAEKFYYKALLFNNLGGQGTQILFDDIVQENKIKRIEKQQLQEFFANRRMQFGVSLAMIGIVFTMIILRNPKLVNFLFNTGFGQVLLCANIALIIGLFTLMVLYQAEDITE